MREIIFRGKRTDTGEWVDGDLIKLDTEVYIAGRLMWAAEPLRETVELQVAEVDPETVGQYTGLKDKNGKRIFECDIVKNNWHSVSGDFIGNVWVVKFGTHETSADYYATGAYGWYAESGEEQCVLESLPGDSLNSTEIIGNVFNNPELLK